MITFHMLIQIALVIGGKVTLVTFVVHIFLFISATTNPHLGPVGDLNKHDSDDHLFSNYYHYVPYIAMVQGLMFGIPALIWDFCESGVTNQLSSGQNGEIINLYFRVKMLRATPRRFAGLYQ